MVNLTIKTLIFTGLALVAFAANSVLCRMALGGQTIDAAGFTIIRLLSGALALYIILKLRHGKNRVASRGSWSATIMLFLYAAAFSFAYITLDTGTGALILFGAVQITMIFLSLISGHRLQLPEWIGLALAFAGLVYLIFPGITAPSFSGFVLMATAGVAWGVYTLKGITSTSPLPDTAYNFLRTLPLALVLMVIALPDMHYSPAGVMLAILSGGVASGLGYTVWYSALAGLPTTAAAVIQLLVPVIAALGGVLFMSETITLRLTVAAAMILGGILLVVFGRQHSGRA